MGTTILVAMIALGVLGLFLGALIGFTAKQFAVETDPRIEEIQELLPGANCGGCGFAGCSDLANAIVTKGIAPDKCPVCSPSQCAQIAAALGTETSVKEPLVAVVFCSGNLTQAHRSAEYNGIQDCRSASLVANGGGKACRFGCLGYGTCARACPFGAIEMVHGLAIVHPRLCKGCGKCEGVCPRKLVRLVPAKAKIHVYCNSLDKPQMRRKNCLSACIACGKCVKADPEHMQMQAQLVRVNYSDPPDASLVERANCPTGAILTEDLHRKDYCATGAKGGANS